METLNVNGKILESKKELINNKWITSIKLEYKNNDKTYKLPIKYNFFCPVLQGDTFYASLTFNKEGNYYEPTIKPIAVPSCEKDVIISLFLTSLKDKSSYITTNKAEKMYEFFKKEADKYIDNINKNNIVEKSARYRTRNNKNLLIMETINELVERDIYDSNTKNVFMIYFEISESQAKKFISWWRKNCILRRLYLLEITKKEILECVDRDWEVCYLYFQLLENPYVVEKIPHHKCVLICNQYGIKLKNMVLEAGLLLRRIDEICTNKAWVCIPIKYLVANVDNYMDYHNILIKEYGCQLRYNCLYQKHQAEVQDFLSKELICEDVEGYLETPPISDKLSSEQIEGLNLALSKTKCIIHGRPGSGKSYLVSEITKELDARNVSYYVVCPTGKACVRLKKLISKTELVMTLHMLCSRNVALEKCDVLIIDENSMCYGTLIKRAILKLHNVNKYTNLRIIFIGDTRQLPSIEPGNFFKELMKSKIPKVDLKVDHRRSDSVLFKNISLLCDYKYKEFVWDENCIYIDGDLKHVQMLVYGLAEKMKEEGLDMNKISTEITVISPYNCYKDEIGISYNIISMLNSYCRSIFVPLSNHKTMDAFGNVWYVGDRIMATENNYDVEIFNGQEGVITGIMKDKLICKFDEKTIEVPTVVKNTKASDEDELSRTEFSSKILTLSWTMTVHKSQGSEWKHVIFFVPKGKKPGNFLNRELFFTAVSRAKDTLHVVGEDLDIMEMIMKASPPERYDNLSYILSGVPYQDSLVDEEELTNMVMEKLNISNIYEMFNEIDADDMDEYLCYLEDDD